MRKKYVALNVEKKLPVFFKGNISAKNKNINGTIIKLSLNFTFVKYFFTKVLQIIIKNNMIKIIKPNIPNSESISKK